MGEATAVMDAFEIISGLSDGWDGYGAGPIRRDITMYALCVLDAIMTPRTPVPHITPMSHEGIMMEWHTKDIDLEIEIEGPKCLCFWFKDRRDGKECEWTTTSNLEQLRNVLSKIKT